MEKPEDATKPHSIRHMLMSGHEDRDRTLRALDIYVADYDGSLEKTEHLLLNLAQWMQDWYNALACEAVDLKHEYRSLAKDAQSNLDAPMMAGEANAEEDQRLQDKITEYKAGMARNEETQRYWSERHDKLREALTMFNQDFRGTNYGFRRR